MGTISREKATKLQGQLENGWKFDVRFYVFHTEYQIKQYIRLSDDKALEFSIGFYEHCINPEETCGYMRKYEGYDIEVRKSEWTINNETGCMSSRGLGIRKMLKENVGNKKAFKLLADISKKYTVEDIRSMYTGQEINQLGLCAGGELLSA